MDNNSFYSVDRLMEFGLGMSVAQQMVKQMNQMMQNMYVPGSIQSMPQPQDRRHRSPWEHANASVQQVYYVAIDSKPVGPMGNAELMNLIQQKKIDKDTLGWMPGMPGWQPIEQIPAILKVVALMPPALPD